MRITFKRVEMHNFMSFSDEVFEFDKHLGLNLICGKNNDIPGSKNGCGKTQLGESLCYALYGQTRNSIKNINICNKYVNSKEMRVTVFFDVEDHKYKVSSGFNKYGAPYCNVSELSDGNDIDLTKSSIAETRKYIADEILHCDMSIFLRTILLSSDQNYNFFRLRKGEKKDFIEKLFDISIFGNMYNAIHRDVLNADKDMCSIQNKLLVLNNADNDYVERMKKYESDKLERLAKLDAQLNSLRTKLDEIKNLNIKSNSDKVEKYELAIDKINDATSKLNSNIRELSDNNAKIDIAAHKFKLLKDQKHKAIDKHAEIMSKLCKDCKTIFCDYYNISACQDEIAKIDEDLAILNEKKRKNDASISELREKTSDYEKKITKANEKIQELSHAYNKATKEISILEGQIIVTECDAEKCKNSDNPYAELYENNKQQLKSEQSQLEKTSEKYKYLKIAENIVSQDTLRKFIISDLVGLLNNKIKMYLTRFGAKYSVKFDSDMEYEFITEAGTCEYDNFSAGERARLMIAACFAFRDFMYIRNSLSCNILILDEFIDGAIDSLAIESILDMLKNFSTIWKQNIFVISHRHEVNNDVFNNIIQIVKTDNIAKITYL